MVSIQPFGCFVEFAPGLEGLVHVSELDVNRVVTAEGFLADKPVVSVTKHEDDLIIVGPVCSSETLRVLCLRSVFCCIALVGRASVSLARSQQSIAIGLGGGANCKTCLCAWA